MCEVVKILSQWLRYQITKKSDQVKEEVEKEEKEK